MKEEYSVSNLLIYGLIIQFIMCFIHIIYTYDFQLKRNIGNLRHLPGILGTVIIDLSRSY